MKFISQIPGCLAIVKLDERHYQVNDTSRPSIGLCLGVFPNDEAARSFADKIAKIRTDQPDGYLRDQLARVGPPFKPAISSLSIN